VPLFQIAHRVGDLAERIGHVDDRRHLTGFDECLRNGEVSFFGCDKNTFFARQTPVTSAPYDLAISRERSHASDAPMIKTRCAGYIRPVSQRACRAANAEMGKAAACYNVMLRGFIASASLR